jgi:hypothetical protein
MPSLESRASYTNSTATPSTMKCAIYVDPQVSTPQIERRKHDAAEACDEQVTPTPRTYVRQAEYGTRKNRCDGATTGEFLQPLDHALLPPFDTLPAASGAQMLF